MKVYMGVKPWILLGDASLAHEILSQNGGVTSNRPFQHYTHKLYSRNRGIIFPNPSDEWNKTRTACNKHTCIRIQYIHLSLK